MKEVYTSADLWLASLFLAESNAELVDIQVSKNGKETISFSFRGENLSQLAHSYCQDKAKANVTRLRRKMNDLRDLIFASKQKKI